MTKSELDLLLEIVGKLGYLFHAFSVDQHGPDVVAAVRNYGGCADVFILWDEGTACAYRAPTGPAFDVFNPTRVYWWYGTNPVRTLRALITLAPPGRHDAPTTFSDAPRGYGIPAGVRTPVRMRKRGH